MLGSLLLALLGFVVENPRPVLAYTLGPCRWPYSNGSAVVTYYDPFPADSKYRLAIEDGLSTWSAPAFVPSLHFAAQTSAAGADIVFASYSEAPDGTQAGGAAGLTSYPNGCTGDLFNPGVLVRFNTHYTDGYSQEWDDTDMLHEIGHAIGLNHVYPAAESCPDPLMDGNSGAYLWYCGANGSGPYDNSSQNKSLLMPLTDDVDGARYLYPTPLPQGVPQGIGFGQFYVCFLCNGAPVRAPDPTPSR